MADPGGTNPTMPPARFSYTQWPIRPHSSLKQHVNMIKVHKKHEIFKRKFYILHIIAKTFQFQGPLPPDLLTRSFAPKPHCGLCPQIPLYARATAFTISSSFHLLDLPVVSPIFVTAHVATFFLCCHDIMNCCT